MKYMTSKELTKAIQEVTELTEQVKSYNRAIDRRRIELGIINAEPLTKAELIHGEEVVDFLGRQWKVCRKKLIPLFSQPRIMGVQSEIVEGKQYTINSGITQWYRPKQRKDN